MLEVRCWLEEDATEEWDKALKIRTVVVARFRRKSASFLNFTIMSHRFRKFHPRINAIRLDLTITLVTIFEERNLVKVCTEKKMQTEVYLEKRWNTITRYKSKQKLRQPLQQNSTE